MKIYHTTFNELPGALPEKFFVIFHGVLPCDDNIDFIRENICKEDIHISDVAISPGVFYSILDDYKGCYNDGKAMNILLVTSNPPCIEYFKSVFKDLEFINLKDYKYPKITELKRYNLGIKIYAIWNQLPTGEIGSFCSHSPELAVRFKDDMSHFKLKTMGRVVIMGSNTFKSMNCVPLHNRLNIVITHNVWQYKKCKPTMFNHPIYSKVYNHKNLYFVDSVDAAVKLGLMLSNTIHSKEMYVIGGAQIYAQMFDYTDAFIISVTNVENKKYFKNACIHVYHELLKNIDIIKTEEYEYSGALFFHGEPVNVEGLKWQICTCVKSSEPKIPMFPFLGFNNDVPLIIK